MPNFGYNKRLRKLEVAAIVSARIRHGCGLSDSPPSAPSRLRGVGAGVTLAIGVKRNPCLQYLNHGTLPSTSASNKSTTFFMVSPPENISSDLTNSGTPNPEVEEQQCDDVLLLIGDQIVDPIERPNAGPDDVHIEDVAVEDVVLEGIVAEEDPVGDPEKNE
ncbi:hypothetical protein AgCh_017235 [Apium graveolens]